MTSLSNQPSVDHLFRPDGDELVPTDLVRGPWDHGYHHGGAVAAALAWTMGQTIDQNASVKASALQLCRLTIEILRPVPVTALTHRAWLAHDGRQTKVVSAELVDDGQVVARGSSQWVAVGGDRPKPTSDGDRVPGLSLPWPAIPRRPPTRHDPGVAGAGYPRPGFNCDVFDLRCLLGIPEEPGPGIAWARMAVDVVEGSRPTAADRLAAVSDLGNAVGWQPSPAGQPMINPDVTLQIVRYPKDDWVCLQSKATITTVGTGVQVGGGVGVGMMETILWDGDGQIGRVLSTIVESPISPTVTF